MPKIIDNLRQKLIDETKRQIESVGYGETTVRSVAAGCGVGVGTVYNYFPSKDAMTAAWMLQDWEQTLHSLSPVCRESGDVETMLRAVYEAIDRFTQAHGALFRDPAAQKAFSGAAWQYHGTLRAQIAALLEPLCMRLRLSQPQFRAQFAAESLLTWTAAHTPFDVLAPVLGDLFHKTTESQ